MRVGDVVRLNRENTAAAVAVALSRPQARAHAYAHAANTAGLLITRTSGVFCAVIVCFVSRHADACRYPEHFRPPLRDQLLPALQSLSTRTRDAQALRIAAQVLLSDARGALFNPDSAVPHVMQPAGGE